MILKQYEIGGGKIMLCPWHFLLVVVIGPVFALTVIIDLEVVAVLLLVVGSGVSDFDS